MSKFVDISLLGICLFCWGFLIDDFIWMVLLIDLWYIGVVWEMWGCRGYDRLGEEKYNLFVYLVLCFWLL